MSTLHSHTLFWNFSKLPTFVPPLFTWCIRATVLQNCHTWRVHVLFTYCSFMFCSRFVPVLQLCNRCCTFVTPGFVHVLFYCCKIVTVAKMSLLQNCHRPPRVCKLLSCCLSPFWGEILNICHFVTIGHLCHHWSPLSPLVTFVTIGHHWSPLVTIGHHWSPLVTFDHHWSPLVIHVLTIHH